MDGWSDVTGKSIYAVVAISSSTEYILSIDDLSAIQHNAENLKEYLTSIIFQNNCIEPSSIIALVTDTPHVMEKMKSEIQKDNKNIIPLKCVLHVLNLISKDIAHHQISRDTINSNSKIVNFFKSSHLMLSWIKEYQKSRKIKNGMSLFTETRWYSLSKLCISIQTYKEAFKEAVKTLNITNNQITEIINDDIHFFQNKYL